MIKVALISLGCPKNLVDSEYMLGALSGAGFRIVDNSDADIVIINTCTFVDDATAESMDVIEELAASKSRNRPKVIAAGCLAQRYGEDLLKKIPGLDGIIGVADVCSVVNRIEDIYRGVQGSIREPGLYYDSSVTRTLTTGYHAWLAVAGGCDNNCAYCIIPAVRGAFRSRRIDSIIREAEQLVAAGARELILAAQDTFRYGIDLYSQLRLGELLKRLAAVDGAGWIRVMYGHPVHLDREILQIMADLPEVVPYLDLPLQHSSDHILHSMGRRYTRAKALEALKMARDIIPGLVVRSTFITGLPGETEEDFDNMLNFLQEARLNRVGFFPYSPQPGTEAARMDNQVPRELAEERAVIAGTVQEEISAELLSNRKGKVLEVLVEGPLEESFREAVEEMTEPDGIAPGLNPAELGKCLFGGRDAGSAPDIDGLVFLEGAARPGTFVKAVVTSAGLHDMTARVLGETR